ncbi:MAG: S-layer homology domain-containing protein [Oscillospiraceae bacterium]|nr:S-layer homology domain-containing protein [Oscillospiraceae bacterium]
MKKTLGLILFTALLLIGTAAQAEIIEYHMEKDESVILRNIYTTTCRLDLNNNYDVVSYDSNGDITLASNLLQALDEDKIDVESDGYAIITALSELSLQYDGTYFIMDEAPHPALIYMTIEPNQCIELTCIKDGFASVVQKSKYGHTKGNFYISKQWPEFRQSSIIDYRPDLGKSVYMTSEETTKVISFPYDAYEIKDLGNPFFADCLVDTKGMYFTCTKTGGRAFFPEGISGMWYELYYNTSTGEKIKTDTSFISNEPLDDTQTVHYIPDSPVKVKYMYDYFTVSKDSPFSSLPPAPEPTLPPIDKSMDDMTVLELINEYPVKEDYSASSEVVLFSNIQEVAVLYNVCDVITDKVDDMSGKEYAEVSEPVDGYLHDVDDAYKTLNVEDFSAVKESETYSELSKRRENVNEKISLEPPKIVSVDSIYPSADFKVEVHSMYTTKTKREYALEFSNLSKGHDISVTNGFIGQNSYSDRLTLYSADCEAKNRVKIDMVYNGVNCSDTKGCSFTGTVLEPDTKSEWAENEIDAAIALGLVPEELQKNYTSRISRRGFCLLAARAVEVSTGQTISSYALSHGHENNSFSDTVEPEILSSARLGIVYGYEDGTFLPNAYITREQAAAMLSRCAKLLGMSYGSVGGTFADSALISQWAAESVAFVRSNEIMAGDTENNFMPLDGYTVEQAIATFYRMYKKL